MVDNENFKLKNNFFDKDCTFNTDNYSSDDDNNLNEERDDSNNEFESSLLIINITKDIIKYIDTSCIPIGEYLNYDDIQEFIESLYN